MPRLFLLIALTALAALPALTQETRPASDADTVAVVRGLNRIGYESVHHPIAITNRGVEQMYIDALEFKVRDGDMQVDETPFLVFQLTPFLDLLAVHISNLGWGAADGHSFSLLNPSVRTEDGSRFLLDLLDLEKVTVTLGSTEREQTLFFAMGDSATPFTTVGSPVNLDALREPASTERLEQHVENHTVQRISFFRDHRLSTEDHHSGIERIAGQLHLRNGRQLMTPYFGRTLAKFPATATEELLLKRLTYKSARGELLHDPLFGFGDMRVESVFEVKSRTRFGITVNLGDEQQKSIRCPVELVLEPGESITFDLEFATEKSSRFEVSAVCEYRIGEAAVNHYPLQQRFRGRTRVPRAMDLSYAGTEKFLRRLRTEDPHAEQRASEVVNRYFDGASAPRVTAIENAHPGVIRMLNDALLLLLTSTSEGARQRGLNCITALAQRIHSEAVPVVADTGPQPLEIVVGGGHMEHLSTGQASTTGTMSIHAGYQDVRAESDLLPAPRLFDTDSYVPQFSSDTAPRIDGLDGFPPEPAAPNGPQTPNLDRLCENAFPLLCVHQPEEAVDIAISEFRNGSRSHVPLIAYCIVFKQTQPFLNGNATVIREALAVRKDEGQWDGDIEFALGALLGIEGYSALLAKKLAAADVYDVPLLIWAASQSRNGAVDRAVRQRLQQGDMVADEMVRELLRFRSSRYRDSVVQLASSASESEFRQQSLKIYLQYLQEYPGGDLRPLLIQLRSYPYSSEIRTLSRRLLNEVPDP